MLILTVVCALQAQPIDALIRALGDEAVETRQKAADEILSRWKTWTEADLKKLEAATSSKDSEVAQQCLDSFTTIRFYRTIPENVWKAFPKAGPILRVGSPDEVADFFDRLGEKWKERELTTREVLPIAIGALEDKRPTSRTELGKGGIWHMPASFPAYTLLHAAVPRFYYNTEPQVVRAWWVENKSRPEREWYLSDLAAEDQRLRGGAIQRLFALEDPSLHTRLFEALKTIEDEYAFELALKHASRFPKETIERGLTPYLKDPSLRVRFLTARLFEPFDRRRAIDSVADAFENPRQMKYPSLHVVHLDPYLAWLAKTDDKRAIGVVRKSMASGALHLKLGALNAAAGHEAAWTEDLLVKALSDPERDQGTYMGIGGIEINHPRVCDLAGIYLYLRFKFQEKFNWQTDVSGRDKNLGQIWTLYREKKGLPPAPFHPPGMTPVPEERVKALLDALKEDGKKPRLEAVRALSKLGAGAWPHLERAIKGSQGKVKENLKAAALAFSNTVRKVTLSKAASDRAKFLEERLHDPLDLDLLGRKVLTPWFNDHRYGTLVVGISREASGRGIEIEVGLEKIEPGEGDPEIFSFSHGGGTAGCYWRESTYKEQWEKVLDELRAVMKQGGKGHYKKRIRVTKSWKK